MKRDVLYSLSTLQRYKQSALQKKELKAFFGKYFNENTICINFQFHDSKSRESCLIISICRQACFKGCSPKEAVITNSFVERLEKIHENIKA